MALYKQMDVMDCVAEDAQSYVDIAFRAANDKTWANEIKAKITSHSDVLFEDIEAVHELERFFERSIKRARERNVVV
jgi:predicted O-linked N-acetylglucosamine transferase (SPINDLY family)